MQLEVLNKRLHPVQLGPVQICHVEIPDREKVQPILVQFFEQRVVIASGVVGRLFSRLPRFPLLPGNSAVVNIHQHWVNDLLAFRREIELGARVRFFDLGYFLAAAFVFVYWGGIAGQPAQLRGNSPVDVLPDLQHFFVELADAAVEAVDLHLLLVFAPFYPHLLHLLVDFGFDVLKGALPDFEDLASQLVAYRIHLFQLGSCKNPLFELILLFGVLLRVRLLEGLLLVGEALLMRQKLLQVFVVD